MKRELLGKPVTETIDMDTMEKQKYLIENNQDKELAIIRVGENPDDIYYENSAIKKAEKLNIKVKQIIKPANVLQEEMESLIKEINADDKIGGVLLLRPLPKELDEEKIVNILNPNKDIDGITDISKACIYSGKDGFAPCTAEAVIKMLNHHEISLQGKKVVILGRSLVIGKPVAMMFLDANATITICHSKTKDIEKISKEADILVSSMGRAKMVDENYVRNGQIVIDVGINVDENGKMCGDVNYEKVKDIVGEITPVPRGIGTVTTAILMNHHVIASSI